MLLQTMDHLVQELLLLKAIDKEQAQEEFSALPVQRWHEFTFANCSLLQEDQELCVWVCNKPHWTTPIYHILFLVTTAYYSQESKFPFSFE